MTKDEVVFWAAGLAFIASIGATAIAFLNGFNSRRRAALAEIASHRVQWIERLREATSKLNSNFVGMTLRDQNYEAHRIEAYERMLYIQLLMGAHEEANALMSMRTAFQKIVDEDGSYTVELVDFNEDVERVIKSVWEQAKGELRGQVAS